MSQICVRGLSKSFGSLVAVEDVSFDVEPGLITGLLGANGSGKSTTMHLMVGLTRGSGRCTFGDRSIDEFPFPRREVGVMVGEAPFHLGRSGWAHLRMLAAGIGLPCARVDAVLEIVGLAEVARRRIGTYSLGMRKRLSLAAALLGDPPTLVLDEPTNVLNEASSYLDHVVMLDRGNVRADERLSSLLSDAPTGSSTIVSSASPSLLIDALTSAGLTVDPSERGRVVVRGADAARVGAIAASAGLVLTELTSVSRSLEDVFMEMSRP